MSHATPSCHRATFSYEFDRYHNPSPNGIYKTSRKGAATDRQRTFARPYSSENKNIGTVGVVVVATSELEIDDQIEFFCNQTGCKVFRGSERDVLARYFECARLYNMKNIVRLTADNPFVDQIELLELISSFERSNADYSNNFNLLPIGLGSEIFTRDALERSYKEGLTPHHREHVNEYILENPAIFHFLTQSVPSEKRRPEIRLTVDTPDDILRIRFIETNAKSKPVTTAEAIRLAEQFENVR